MKILSLSSFLLGFLREKKPCGGTSITLVCFVGTGGVHDHFLLEAEHAQLLLLNSFILFLKLYGKKKDKTFAWLFEGKKTMRRN
jgi:hypothetical protein